MTFFANSFLAGVGQSRTAKNNPDFRVQ